MGELIAFTLLVGVFCSIGVSPLFIYPLFWQVTLGRVLRGVLTLRGLLIEGVLIRSYNESNLDKNGKVSSFL